jgi:hypothetical protein
MHIAPRKSATGGRVTSGQSGDASGSPLTVHAATDRLQRIVRDGTVAWSRHALDRARAARITTPECGNAMVSGVADPPEFANGQWQYRIHSPRMWIVLTFRSDDEAAVVDVGRRSR